jgi:hypothetical protein
MKHNIKVDVLGKSGTGRYRLKVSVHDIGIHVMGMLIQDSVVPDVKWYVVPPAHKVGAKYYKDITFDTSQTLWQEIEQSCIKQIEAYLELESIIKP